MYEQLPIPVGLANKLSRCLFLELGPWPLGVLAEEGLLNSWFLWRKSEATVFGCTGKRLT